MSHIQPTAVHSARTASLHAVRSTKTARVLRAASDPGGPSGRAGEKRARRADSVGPGGGRRRYTAITQTYVLGLEPLRASLIPRRDHCIRTFGPQSNICPCVSNLWLKIAAIFGVEI